jgi:molybdate transport system permease protein
MIDFEALRLTLRLAALTTVILLALAIPLACWLVFTRARLRPLAEALAMLPLVMPPTVLGFYLLMLLGPRTGVGRWLIKLTGHPLAFSFSGLVVGSVVYSFPFALQPLLAGFAQVRPELLEAARLLGATRLRMLLEIVLPLSARSLAAAAVLSFMHTVGEFGVVLMIGGDVPGVTRTLSIALLDQVQGFDYAAANRTALLLLGASMVTLTALYSLRRSQPRD